MSREEREAVMLREAGAVFAARGFHAASMDEIADRVGVSKPMVYSYFGSKEALYFAYIEDAGRDLLAAIVRAEREVRDAAIETRLRAGTRAFFQFVADHRDGYSVLFSEMAAAGGPLRREVSAIRRRIVDLVQYLIADEALSEAYVGAGEALANWWIQHPEDDVDAMTDRLVAVAWVGLRQVVSEHTNLG
jgi:AcrR family transcriptional regulator